MVKADLIKKAVSNQRRLSNRAEEYKPDHYRKLFVDNTNQNFANLMSGSANQVIFGRRGTGKTMLLNKLLRDGRPFNSNGKYIAIMVQVPDFHRSIELNKNDTPILKAKYYFREFLYQFSNELLRFSDDILQNENFLTKIGLINKSKNQVLVDRIFKLHEILQKGIRLYRIDKSYFNDYIEDSNQKEIDYSSNLHNEISGSTKIKYGIPSASIDLHPNYLSNHIDNQSSIHKEIKTQNLSGEFDYGIPEIRDGLKDIIDMLKIENIMILIDEWQALDIDCQSEFAHFLFKCLFGIKYVSVKIAAYRHICNFNNGGNSENFRGVELGQDIEVVGDTDLPPTEEYTIKFMFNILYRRLIFDEPDLEKYYGSPENFDYTILINDIFNNKRVAEILVRGSHGILRDFIKAFNKATDSCKYDIARNKITIEHVNKAYSDISKEVQDNVHSADDIGGLLFEMIKPHIFRTGKPYFFISENDHQWDKFLWELVEKRAIHVVPKVNLPPGVSVDWKCFELSYGLFLSWIEAYTFKDGGESPQIKWSNVSKKLLQKDIESTKLQISRDPISTRKCDHCHKQFSTSSTSYMKKKLCPYCFNAQND